MSTVRLLRKNAVIAALLVLFGGLQAGEVLEFPLLPDWDFANSQESPHQTITEFVGSGEDIDNWSRLLAVTTHGKDGSLPDLHAYYEHVRAVREAMCPGMTQWTIIEQTANSIIYESRTTKACRDHPAQHELGRLLEGTDSWYRVSITLRGTELSEETRKKWIELLQVAGIKEEPY